MDKEVTMKTSVFAFCALLLFSLFAVSCDVPKGDYKSFDYNLQGTWVSNEPNASYTGSLIIDHDTITITGYGENWLSLVTDDNKRPFKGYPRNAPINGYSQDGQIFIEYGALAQTGIPYTYTPASYPSTVSFLEFNFGGRAEILQKTE